MGVEKTKVDPAEKRNLKTSTGSCHYHGLAVEKSGTHIVDARVRGN